MLDHFTALDFTLALRPSGATYLADPHLDNPESAAPVVFASAVPLALDLQALLALTNDLVAYGHALTTQIFPAGSPLHHAWQQARALADGANRPLRLRLRLAASAPELHPIIWERLCDPRTDQPLALHARLRLVRTLDSAETRPLKLEPKPDLRALLAVANPRDLGSYGLAELDPDGEALRARQALGTIPLTVVGDASDAVAPRATLTTIQAALRDGPTILALMAHAQDTTNGTVLYLEDEAGMVERVTGTDFVTMLRQLERPPLLVVLLACDSGGAIAALGPQLAQVGVGAVVAMQTRLSIPAARRFLPALFADLARDGQLDRAVSVARAALRDGHEWATPAVWLRTRDGRLWEDEPPPARRIDPVAAQELLATLPLETIPPPDSFARVNLPHRLPLLPNELFTGRDTEVRTLAQALKAGTDVLVTTGMGGVGKTSLAVEVAHRYGRYFAGGVFWINCSDPAQVAQEIAAGGGPGGLDLPGFAELPDLEREQQVKAAWREAVPRLLIFDNCEDEAILRAHRPTTGGCRIIVTSRRQIWRAGQRLQVLDLEVFERAASITLLCALANQYQPTWLTAAQAEPLADLLGDLPLALHLAGSYLALYPSTSPQQFLDDVKQRRLQHTALRDPQGEFAAPTLAEQQRASALFAVLTLGLERLDPQTPTGILARTLLAWAACLDPAGTIFPRDLLVQTAPLDEADPERRDQADAAITQLINLGVLDQEAGGRLRMHRLVRDAVVQAALLDDPMRSFAPRALAYCAALIDHANTLITEGQIVAGRTLLDQEQALWSQFLAWSYAHEQRSDSVSLGARATAQLRNYWNLVDAYANPAITHQLQDALALAQRCSDRLGEANVRKAIGDVQQFRDDRDAALRSYEQALALFREIGDRLGEANVLQAIGDVQQFRKATDAALRSYEQALALFREIGDRLGEANVLAAQGQVALINGDQGVADELLDQAIAIYQDIGDRYSVPAQIGNYGWVLRRAGRIGESRPYLLRAAEGFAAMGLSDYAERHYRAAEDRDSPAPDLLDIPDAVREALEARDGVALQSALEALPEAQRAAVISQLQEAGIIGRGPDMAEILRQFEPLLAAIAAVANGDQGPREEIETVLLRLEQQGWQLAHAVQRIWAGERERAALVAELDAQDTALIDHLLGLLSTNHQETTMPTDSSAALAAITTAAEGLWMPSETDAPFEPFAWPGPDPLTPAALLAALDLPADTPVAQADALALLDRLAADQDWFGDQERASAARFAALRDTMTSHLTALTLYRLGQIRITLVMVGRDANGQWVGLKTLVVET